MAKKLDFKDFLTVDYTQTGDPQLAKNAKKRKQDIPTGNTGESVEPADEALSMAARRKKAITMKKIQARLKVRRKKASMKVADKGRLEKRARKAARNAIAKKLTKGVSKVELTPARKAEIEKRLDKMQGKVSRLANKMLPKIRKSELEKKRG